MSNKASAIKIYACIKKVGKEQKGRKTNSRSQLSNANIFNIYVCIINDFYSGCGRANYSGDMWNTEINGNEVKNVERGVDQGIVCFDALKSMQPN